MNLKRLLTTPIGRFFISLILGLGLATFFKKVCTDKNCIQFNGPVIDEVDGKTYQFGEFCYKYDLFPTKCDPKKQTIEIYDIGAKKVLQNNNAPKPVSTTSSKSMFGF